MFSSLVSVLLRWNVSLCFWATVSALVCLVCSSTFVRIIYDDMIYENGSQLQITLIINVVCCWFCIYRCSTINSTWIFGYILYWPLLRQLMYLSTQCAYTLSKLSLILGSMIYVAFMGINNYLTYIPAMKWRNNFVAFAALRMSCRGYKESNQTISVWQSPACSPPAANAPAKLRGYWTKLNRIVIIHRRVIVDGLS